MKFFKAGSSKSELTHEVAVADVTAYAGDFDTGYVEVIRTAPVWMTRAERLLLFTLAFTLRPQRYLEIGTLHGGSALIVCSAMNAGQTDGRIVCLDPRPQIAPETWAQLQQRATVVTGLSPQALPQAQQAAGGAFDLILIDGDHTRAGVLRDANAVLSVASPGCHILFHDCFNPDVKSGIDEFARKHAARLVDSGPMTREITSEVLPNGARMPWGGLRMIEVQR
jgi:predicted O-methyltransferase YrrM